MRLFTSCVAGAVLSGVCMLHASAPCRGAADGPYFLRPIPSSAAHHRHAPRIQFWDGTSITDLNWSGYAAETNITDPASGAVTGVSGSWVVPAVTGSGRTDTYSSAWVGIDGDSDDTVEQIGTEQDWTPRGAVYYAWFEMYPQGSYEIANFPIAPGNVISAKVTYVGETTSTGGRGGGFSARFSPFFPGSVTTQTFQLTITNVTKNKTYTVPVQYSTITGAERSSAEWIVEAPSSYYGVLPMADFGTVSFAKCEATINGTTGPIDDGSWQNEAIEASNDGTTSTPSGPTDGPNGSAFSITWAK